MATGQDDNIGDVILRREYLHRLREIGHLNIFVGASSADFIEGLRLDETQDATYADLSKWHAAAWRALAQGRVWLVDKPGELQLDAPTLRRQLKLLPLVAAVRLRRGQVLRLGMAVRGVDTLYLNLLRPLYLLSTMVRWRDTATGAAFRFGGIEPDWAFGWRQHLVGRTEDPLSRRNIAVSYRGDRDLPSDSILDSITAAAQKNGQQIVVVTQVRRDAERSLELASRLGAELVPWPDDRSSADHEEIIRNVYRRCALVVSDRLHALIVAMTEGAPPLCITDRGEPKIERHLEAVGFQGSTARLHGGTGTPIIEVIERQIERQAEVRQMSLAALRRLDLLTEHLKADR